MRRFRGPLALAALFLCAIPTRALPAPTDFVASGAELTLERAIARARRGSPMLSAARRQVDATAGGVLQAGLRRNPSFGALVEDTRRDARTTTATIDWPLEVGGQRAARTLAAERTREAAEAELTQVAADLDASVTAAFFEILIAQERLVLAEDSSALATRGAQVVGQRVTAGKVSPVDETRARVDAVDAELAVVEAESALVSARRALAALWGESELHEPRLAGEVDALVVDRPIADWDALAERAPGVLAGRVEVARQRALLDVEKSRRVPDLVVTLGAKRDNALGRTQAVIGLSVPLPLFDRNQGGIVEAARRSDRADDAYRATRIQVVHDLQQAHGRLLVARRTATTLRTVLLPAAGDALRAATRGFEAGKFGFIDVLDAQRTLLAARTRYLVALSSAVQAATAIDRLLGRETP